MSCNKTITVPGVSEVIRIGVWDEQNARSVSFDVSAWQSKYGDGTLQIIVNRPGETIEGGALLIYEAAQVEFANGVATWTFDETDTAIPGRGSCALIYRVGGDVVAKTTPYQTFVADTLGHGGLTPPTPLEDWYQRVLAASDAAQTAQVEAEASAEASETSAAASANSASDAQAAAESVHNMTATAHGITGTDPTVEKTIDPETGAVNLDFGIPVGEEKLDYDDLINKPAINGVELSGNQSGAELGLDRTYVHTQGVASAIWTITHNLDKYPSVVAVDSLNRIVGGDITYPDANTVIITFNAAVIGRAFLN